MNFKLSFLLVLLAAVTIRVSAQVDPLATKGHQTILKTGVVGSSPQHMEEAFWMDEVWVPYATEDIQYTNDGSPTVIERSDPEGKTRELLSYDNRGWAVESVMQIWIDNLWVNQTREIDNFDGEQYLGYTEETWTDGAWVLVEGMSYEYQKDNDLVEELIIKLKRPEEDWINYQKYSYIYVGSSNLVASLIIESWEEEKWVNSMKIENEYEDDLVVESLYYSYDGTAWIVNTKMTETYGDYDSYYLTNYTLVDGEWAVSSRTSYEYDSHGNETLFLIEFYTDGWQAYMGDKFNLTYDGNNLTQRITQNYNLDWVNALKEVFSNFHTAGITASLNDDLSFQTFPNPAKESLFVKASNPGGTEDIQITIYSITGQKALSNSFSLRNGTQQLSIPVDQLKRGAYIIRIQDEKGRAMLNEMIQIY